MKQNKQDMYGRKTYPNNPCPTCGGIEYPHNHSIPETPHKCCEECDLKDKLGGGCNNYNCECHKKVPQEEKTVILGKNVDGYPISRTEPSSFTSKKMEEFDEIVNTWKEPKWTHERHDKLIDYTATAFTKLKYLFRQAIEQAQSEAIKEAKELGYDEGSAEATMVCNSYSIPYAVAEKVKEIREKIMDLPLLYGMPEPTICREDVLDLLE